MENVNLNRVSIPLCLCKQPSVLQVLVFIALIVAALMCFYQLPVDTQPLSPRIRTPVSSCPEMEIKEHERTKGVI